MKRSLRLSTLVGILALAACTRLPEGITPVQGFELKPYLGEWHEVARLASSLRARGGGRRDAASRSSRLVPATL